MSRFVLTLISAVFKGGESMSREMPDIGKNENSAAEVGTLSPLERFEELMKILGKWATYVGMIFLVILMMVITVDVCLRIFFNSPIKGVNEMAEYSLLILIFMTISFVQSLKVNISVDILFSRLPSIAQKFLDLLTNLLCLLISSLMLRQSLVFNRYLANSNSRSMILKLPLSPIQFVMVIGLAMLSVVFLIQIINSVIKMLNPAS